MTVENVKAFFKNVQTDKSLQAKLKNVQAANKDEAVAAMIQIAADAGFEFDAEQYEQATMAHTRPVNRKG